MFIRAIVIVVIATMLLGCERGETAPRPTVMASNDSNSKRLEWATAMLSHEGFPLALRVRPNVDDQTNNARFPHLAILTQKLTAVRSNGLPESDYNESLADFDAAVHETLENAGNGLILIIETFGGERTYYACVTDLDVQTRWLNSLSAKYPEHELTASSKRDGAWRFYRRYRDDFKW